MTFDIAKKIAYAASELDWLKNRDFRFVALEVKKHIDTLHECAKILAGNRAREIYTDPDVSPPAQTSNDISDSLNKPPTLAKVFDFHGQN